MERWCVWVCVAPHQATRRASPCSAPSWLDVKAGEPQPNTNPLKTFNSKNTSQQLVLSAQKKKKTAFIPTEGQLLPQRDIVLFLWAVRKLQRLCCGVRRWQPE